MLFQSVFQNIISVNLYAISNRQLRSAMRDKRLPKLIKGKVATLRDETDDFNSIKTYQDLNKTLKEMFIEPEELRREVELQSGDDCNDVFQHSDQLLDVYKSEERYDKSVVRKRILKRHFFKELQETNLLTHAAKIQIRYLHYINPDEWTPQKLSECFPVSISGVKELLKCNSVYLEKKKADAIKAHDKVVAERWECLKNNQNLSEFSPITLKLWREGKLVRDFYSGNPALPQPEIPKADIIVKPKKVGEFAAIVKKYVETKTKNQENSLVNLQDAKTNELLKQNDESKDSENRKELRKFYIRNAPQKDLEDRVSATYLATNEIDPLEPDIPFNQFKENLAEEYANKKDKTSTDKTYYEWLKEQKSMELTTKKYEVQPCNPEDVVCKIKKFDSNVIELKTDYLGGAKVPYLFNSDQGYQYPYGKDITQYKIRIPNKLYKRGATFKIGQSFYDDRGYFLYKVPLEINVK